MVYLPKTRLEAFESQISTVIYRGTANVGTISGKGSYLAVKCREATEATSGHKEYGVAISIREGDNPEEITTLDYEELPGLLDAIDRLSKVDYTSTSFSDFEATFVTRGELRLVTYKSGSATNVRAVVHSGGINRVKSFLSLEQLTQFRGLIAEAKAKLDVLNREK